MARKILGVSAFFHDSAAALLSDGRIERAASEERWTRIKHDPSFPLNALKFCLETGPENDPESPLESLKDTDLKDIDALVFYEKPFLTFERLLETALRGAPFKGFAQFKEAMPLYMGKKLNIRSLIRKELKKAGLKTCILFSSHHLSHAASAFYPSPFEKAAVLCLDGVGEFATSSGWRGEGRRLRPLWQMDYPHSLGLFYSAFTEYCGFKVNTGEYKLMGLAPYGEPEYVSLLKDNVIHLKKDGGFRLNMEYFDYLFGMRMTSPMLHKLLGKGPRKPEAKIERHYMGTARSVQCILEEAVFNLSRRLHRETGAENLCLAGGVALNCAANGKILKNSPFSSLWAQPAAGDAGGSLGAALAAYHLYFQKPRAPKTPDSMRGAMLGPEYSRAFIEKTLSSLKNEGLRFEFLEEEDFLIEKAAESLVQGKIIGWFQGRMEFGPRALGCRSVLADPRRQDMQNAINQKIKGRESFRPFAVSILKDKTSFCFEEADSPYMLLTAFVLPEKRKNEKLNSLKKGLEKLPVDRSPLPAATHVDYSTRIQTVDRKAGPEEVNVRYKKLLENFFEKTGCPALLNTSLNVRGEPIVRSPAEALQNFQNTETDLLFIGDFVVYKDRGKRRKPGELRSVKPEAHQESAMSRESGQMAGCDDSGKPPAGDFLEDDCLKGSLPEEARRQQSRRGPRAQNTTGAGRKFAGLTASFLQTMKQSYRKAVRIWNQTVVQLFLLMIWVFVLTPTKYIRLSFLTIFNKTRDEGIFKKPEPVSKESFQKPF